MDRTPGRVFVRESNPAFLVQPIVLDRQPLEPLGKLAGNADHPPVGVHRLHSVPLGCSRGNRCRAETLDPTEALYGNAVYRVNPNTQYSRLTALPSMRILS